MIRCYLFVSRYFFIKIVIVVRDVDLLFMSFDYRFSDQLLM